MKSIIIVDVLINTGLYMSLPEPDESIHAADACE